MNPFVDLFYGCIDFLQEKMKISEGFASLIFILIISVVTMDIFLNTDKAKKSRLLNEAVKTCETSGGAVSETPLDDTFLGPVAVNCSLKGQIVNITRDSLRTTSIAELKATLTQIQVKH